MAAWDGHPADAKVFRGFADGVLFGHAPVMSPKAFNG
jgi:hypothetical protein